MMTIIIIIWKQLIGGPLESLHHPIDKLLHRRELSLLNQVKFVDKVDEVLERGVQVSLFLEADNIIEMCMVYVSIDTEEPFQNRLCYCDEVPWERNT